jgi:GMP synthase-like glutamine amidotransferase
MKLGIIETGAPPRSLRGEFGNYPAMFRRLLGEDAYDYSTFDARQPLPAPETCEAWLITGSPAAAYDPDPWVADLIGFLRQAKGKAALVGVCFGHQVMAQAFGGRVEKSPKGWGIGLHHYDVREHAPWMDAGPALAAAASHQDQVVELPPGARVLASSAFTPLGMLAYGDQPAMSLQLHPEFEPAYAKALIEARRGDLYAEDEAARAIASFARPDERPRLAGWINAFLAETNG